MKIPNIFKEDNEKIFSMKRKKVQILRQYFNLRSNFCVERPPFFSQKLRPNDSLISEHMRKDMLNADSK